MKTDLDTIMQSREIDALLVTGPAQHNPFMVYITGGGHLTGGDLIKKRGADPILFYNPMERDEAAKTGLATKNLADYRFMDLLKQTNGDFTKATILRYQQMLNDTGIVSGRVAVCGRIDAGEAYHLFSGLQETMPELMVVGEFNNPMLLEAMATKDEGEVNRIRRMGHITTEVVGRTADYLTSQKVENEVLVDKEGHPLTIGHVKQRINLWLAELGVENPEGTIFAIGRDAGIPHSSGTSSDILRLGKTIVFDIFPCEAGGGYHYDFTRTWCLGYAPDEAIKIYEDVLSVYRTIMSELKQGVFCPEYQKRACDIFEAQGHPTIQSDPQTQEGYVHSLGHGLGIHVHERPWFGKNASEDDILKPGMVTTIEPGLYYPERELGVRLEDTVWLRGDGNFEILAEYSHDLVLEIR